MTAPDGTAPFSDTGQDFWGFPGQTWRTLLFGKGEAPLWMRAELLRLGNAFPAFSFSIHPGYRGLSFEAWREDSAGGLYAVITQDAAELWRELDASSDDPVPAADRARGEVR
jgi:hypothetical protein